MTNMDQQNPQIGEQIKAGLLDDILARIDAEYANYKQTPVFTCQEEELAYWSRTAPMDKTAADNAPVDSNETLPAPINENPDQ